MYTHMLLWYIYICSICDACSNDVQILLKFRDLISQFHFFGGGYIDLCRYTHGFIDVVTLSHPMLMVVPYRIIWPSTAWRILVGQRYVLFQASWNWLVLAKAMMRQLLFSITLFGRAPLHKAEHVQDCWCEFAWQRVSESLKIGNQHQNCHSNTGFWMILGSFCARTTWMETIPIFAQKNIAPQGWKHATSFNTRKRDGFGPQQPWPRGFRLVTSMRWKSGCHTFVQPQDVGCPWNSFCG